MDNHPVCIPQHLFLVTESLVYGVNRMNLRDMQPEKLSLPHKLVIAVISMSLLAIRVGYYTYPRTVSDDQLVVSHNYSTRDVHSFRVGK